jgi:transcriptional regulator with XRE-family HTH domain
MAPSSPAQQQLARRLRELREQQWPERLTQAALAEAFGDVAAATVSSWENSVAPKLAPSERLRAYAQFFATHRSIEGDTPVLLPVDGFSEEEQAAYKALENELLALREEATRKPARQADAVPARRSWHFPDTGPLTIVCAQLPTEQAGGFADPADPNYTELQSFADLDALVELFGHVRAENPHMQVNFRTAPNVVADDLSGHLVLLGGIVWNEVTQRLSEMMPVLPVRQIQDRAVETGEIFTVDDGERFLPKWRDGEPKILTEDVGLLVRAPNPLNTSRALVICNGIHSRGVYGAVRSLTDARLREKNERYIAENFSDFDSFAILMRVPVIEAKALTPDFYSTGFVLYQWP